MTRHVRYKQLNKATIKQATINSIMLRTPKIEENRQVYKAMRILDAGFSWLSPRKWHAGKVPNVIFLDTKPFNAFEARMFRRITIKTWK
ncbi:hypothetical protein PHRODO_29 [Bacillus phage Phrodo]|uniref:hypothetical protein n=1 Tax=Bacillus phage Phrodo TaxID=1805953 RepID=UPI0007A768A1|nr:hypothetical protein BI003_gp029 [Bacillus phage Phrodo]AMW62077.1 hypothetical protein PHRODO_29 [Bacillus phage Phrodo]